jgi:hypothetical protein
MRLATEKKQQPKEHLNQREGGEKNEVKEIKTPHFCGVLKNNGGLHPLFES